MKIFQLLLNQQKSVHPPTRPLSRKNSISMWVVNSATLKNSCKSNHQKEHEKISSFHNAYCSVKKGGGLGVVGGANQKGSAARIKNIE